MSNGVNFSMIIGPDKVQAGRQRFHDLDGIFHMEMNLLVNTSLMMDS